MTDRLHIEAAMKGAREHLNRWVQRARRELRDLDLPAEIEAVRAELQERLSGRGSRLSERQIMHVACRRAVLIRWMELQDAMIEGQRRRARKRYAKAASRWLGRDLSGRTLLTWEGRYARLGTIGLIDWRGKFASGAKAKPIDRELWGALCRLVDSGVSVRAAYDQVSQRHRSGWWPALRTVQKRLRERDNETRGGAAGHSKEGAPSVGTADGRTEPLRLVTSSSTGAPPR